MDSYLIFKHLHMTMATLTLVSFIIRGIWMVRDNVLIEHKLSKILPHIIDSLLLASAVVLVIKSGLYPLTVDWVTMKVVLLIAYIFLGTMALKRAKTKSARIMYFVASILTLLAIFAVASIKPVFG